MNNRELLIVGLFGPTERNAFWSKTQLGYISRTTRTFDYGVFLNRADESAFAGINVIGRSNDTYNPFNNPHGRALNSIRDYFREHEYQNYLILDSDCFPIYSGWFDLLLQKLETSGRKFASPIRFENLDLFPHPCAFFIPGNNIREEWLDFTALATLNLLGKPVLDPGANLPVQHCFPLLRSNVYNFHPLLGAIYHHLFYHHTCGSRVVESRLLQSGYTEHFMDEAPEKVEQRLFQRLNNDPDLYLEELVGSKKLTTRPRVSVSESCTVSG